MRGMVISLNLTDDPFSKMEISSFQSDTDLCLKGFLPFLYFLIATGSWSWRDWGKTFKESLKIVEAGLRRRLFCNLGHEW